MKRREGYFTTKNAKKGVRKHVSRLFWAPLSDWSDGTKITGGTSTKLKFKFRKVLLVGLMSFFSYRLGPLLLCYSPVFLELVGNEPIQGTQCAFAARMSDGTVTSWGAESFGGDCSLVKPRLKNVKTVCPAWKGAFAAIVGDDNGVVCWGNTEYGGDCSSVAGELKQVEGICGSDGAFAALKKNGTVTTWGSTDHGGDSSSVQSRLKGVKAIHSTDTAFAAVLHDGTVEAWGNKDYGGVIPPSLKPRLKQVKSVSGNGIAFAALLSDGTVETWGFSIGGGDSSMVAGQLTQVVLICASCRAFAALRKNGTVVGWGDPAYGGDSSRVQGELTRVVAISSTYGAFAAVGGDGRVVTWGHQGYGGDSSSVAGELKEVVAIRGAGHAFAAVRSDGTVATWGEKDSGGDSSAVQSKLKQIVAISSTALAFAAQRGDSTVVTWGDKVCGGNSSSVPALRKAGATGTNVALGREKEALKRETLRLEAERAKKEEENLKKAQEEEAKRASKEQEEEALKRERELERAEQVERLKEATALTKERERRLRAEQEKVSRLEVELAEKERAAQERQRQLETEREALLRERELWRASSSPSSGQVSTSAPNTAPGNALPALLDGSVEFWVGQLLGVLDKEDIPEAASKLSAGGFRQKHVGDISRDDLKEAGFKQAAIIKDFMKNQHLLGGGKASPSMMHQSKSPALLKQLTRVLEEELTMDQVVGRGAFSVVWRASWRRKISVGKQHVQVVGVAVKMSKRIVGDNDASSSVLPDELVRDLAVISGLPHQNILTLHGVCERKGQGPIGIIYELMSMDLAKLLKESSGSRPLLPTHVLLRVLRDVSAGLAHLHSHGVVHRDVKPANVLLRDEQVKLCDFGSSRDLQHTIEQMSVTGTLDYMAPEVLNREPAGRAADVWSFGVLMFECVTGRVCARNAKLEDLIQELTQAKCLPALITMFVECHQAEVEKKRPSMHNIHLRLQRLVMQEASDSQRLKEELKRAEAQDRETYQATWDEHYGNQPHSNKLLEYAKQRALMQQGVVRQPLNLCGGKGSMEELEQLGRVGGRLHECLKAIVEECGGTYVEATRKKYERCVQKVQQEYGGDHSKLLDLERATGLFEQAEDMLHCLQRIHEECSSDSSASSGQVVVHMTPSSFSSSSSFLQAQALSLRVLRCKDRLNNPSDSGYRDILMNVCEAQSGFVAELQLNFHKIAQIKSQSHRFYELIRVMELQWA